MKLTRTIPQGYTEYKPDINYPNLFACYVNLSSPKPVAIFFTGKQSKPTFHYSFKDVESMKKKINETISRLMSWEDMKAARKEERKNEVSEVKVGDLFVSSWGYEQTNVDFYQCVETKGKRTFVIRPISGKMTNKSTGNGMACFMTPVKDAFLDPEKYPPLTKSSFNLTSYSSLSKTTEGSEHYCSWYA